MDTPTAQVVLARKSGTWLEWAEACRELRKAGTPAQALFETTGFEAQLQERLLASFQVYLSLVENGADENLLAGLKQLGVQPLYELRVLNREERQAAAALMAEKRWSATQTRELVRAVREFFRLPKPPEAFERTAADALAYRAWHLARAAANQSDRFTLVAQGLACSPSAGACQALEALLLQSVQGERSRPRLPLAVPDPEEAGPRAVPVAVSLTTADFKAVAAVLPKGPFGLVDPVQPVAVLPGWLAVSLAGDPVAVLLNVPELSGLLTETGPLLLLVDRACGWEEPSYYATDQEGRVCFDWLASPTKAVLGRVVLALRPPDLSLVPSQLEDPWELEE
ncbi:RuBisCO accumulation factor 1 [Candidatus Cyanaurora vandensis]|uniref:RuBisCO accumulation factor 1 n=1 Tax=Candidatus Cyanaurora vandensis TaxID=2714958 RepID=UPI0025809445|nr:RuBisCO accumulation factor 1 [Candidatus Cyanaurora vandensis]